MSPFSYPLLLSWEDEAGEMRLVTREEDGGREKSERERNKGRKREREREVKEEEERKKEK